MALTTDDETYPQAALGFRVWSVKEGMLCPLFKGSLWRPDTNIAYCMYHKHVAPAADCHCGFNAYHDLRRAMFEAEATWKDDYDNAVNVRELVIGAVAARGTIRIHAHGFRCETAQILGLFPLHQQLGRPPELDPRYQVPIYADAEQLLGAVKELPVEIIPVDARPQSDQEPFVHVVDKGYTVGERIGAIGLMMVFLAFPALLTIAIAAAFGWYPSTYKVLGVYLVLGLLACLDAGLFRNRDS